LKERPDANGCGVNEWRVSDKLSGGVLMEFTHLAHFCLYPLVVLLRSCLAASLPPRYYIIKPLVNSFASNASSQPCCSCVA
jgi:hypothetical protein